MRIETVALALLMVTAGCVGAQQAGTDAGPTSEEGSDEAADEASDGADQVQLETRKLTYAAEVGPSVTSGGTVATFGEARLGQGLVSVEVAMTWTSQANRFGLETERPDGTEHRIDPPDQPGSTSIEGEVPDPQTGPYTFRATAPEGVVAEDTIELTVEATFEATASPSAMGTGQVQTERTSDGWRAEITYETTGDAQPAMDVTADTVNGEVQLAGDEDDQARAFVEAFAFGDTEEEAAERVREIQVTVRVEAGQVTARAELPDGEKWEERGAHLDVGVPGSTEVSGTADTTNGPVEVSSLTARDLMMDTTNGPIQGDLEGQGSIEADTTNGPIDLAFTPTGSTELGMDTTNGPIQLALAEGSDIAYDVDADTTNGEITEDMDEAELEREDEGEARLVTPDGDSRPIQVTGGTDTTNGDIHFENR